MCFFTCCPTRCNIHVSVNTMKSSLLSALFRHFVCDTTGRADAASIPSYGEPYTEGVHHKLVCQIHHRAQANQTQPCSERSGVVLPSPRLGITSPVQGICHPYIDEASQRNPFNIQGLWVFAEAVGKANLKVSLHQCPTARPTSSQDGLSGRPRHFLTEHASD